MYDTTALLKIYGTFGKMKAFDLGLHHNLSRACKVDNIKTKK